MYIKFNMAFCSIKNKTNENVSNQRIFENWNNGENENDALEISQGKYCAIAFKIFFEIHPRFNTNYTNKKLTNFLVIHYFFAK